MNNQNNKIKNTMPYLILFCVIALVLVVLHFQGSTVNELTTGELLKAFKNIDLEALKS